MKTLEATKQSAFVKWLTSFRKKFAKKKEVQKVKSNINLIKHYYIDEDDTHLFI